MKNLFTKWNNAQYKEFELNWINDKESLDVYFVFGKFSHYCEQLMGEIMLKLNLCGWRFSLNDPNYSLFCDYQEYERVWHLMVSYKNMRYDHNHIYAADTLLNNFRKILKQYDFMSVQEYETILKQCDKSAKTILKYM